MAPGGLVEPVKAVVSYLYNDQFASGAVALQNSLRLSGSKYRLKVLAGPSVGDPSRELLLSADIEAIDFTADDIIWPSASKFSGRYATSPEMMFTKLLIFKQVQFSQLLYIDADCIVIKNIDHLLDRETEFWGSGINAR